jgi:chemotaxis protein methyltransferase CheR
MGLALDILIINQHEAFCTFLLRLLTADGHRGTCVCGATEALQAARDGKPDLVILEVAMPEIGAMETVRQLHRLPETRHIPVIVISDFPDLEFELLHVFDFICKPVDIGRLREDLAQLAQGGRRRLPPVGPDHLSSEEYQLFHDYLVTHSGLHFERRNLKILERGVQSRMAALHIGTCQDYFAFLSRNKERRQELQKLLQFLTIGETFFFRYHAHFKALASCVLPELAKSGGSRPLRFWSAGCSTGEEPYTMAMTIMEALPDWRSRDIKILATDINNRALNSARDGVYGRWKTRVTEQRYLDRYFERIGESFVVKDEVKALVEFRHLNLQTDEFPGMGTGGLDAIFCRNVMIYFSLATTKKIVDRFAAHLRPGGYLFLGHAETLSQISSRFERHVQDGGFYYRRRRPEAAGRGSGVDQPLRDGGASRQEPLPAVAARMPAPTDVSQATAANGVAELYCRAMALFDGEQFVAADDLLRQVVSQQPDHAGALLAQGFILASSGRFPEALAACDRVQAIDDLLPAVYFLRGLVYDITERPADAEKEYRTAILLDMTDVMAHYQLGKLYVRLGRARDGLRELRNSLKLLEKGECESLVTNSGGLSREVFLGQLRSELAAVERACA